MTVETKLDRFITLFRNETELRNAIIGLLEHTPNTSGIRHTHGPQEIGKDIVFYSTGPFGGQNLIACVIKNSRITGSADSDDGARTVYIQAEQSLDTPIPNTRGPEERVARVYVISPYDCSPSTVDSIKGKLQSRPGQVVFLCGHELLERFEQHFPEYLLFQSGMLGSYVADLERGLDSDPAVTNVLFRHGFLSSSLKLTSIYVRPKFVRDFRCFTLRLPSPDLGRMSSGITVQKLDEIQGYLRDVADLTAAIEMPGESGAQLQTALRELANDVAVAWQRAFDAHRRRTDLDPNEPKDRSTVALQIQQSQPLVERAKAIVARATPIIADFQERLKSANRLIAFDIASSKAALSSSQVLDYCDVESVSRQVPSLVEANPKAARTLALKEDLIDDIPIDILIVGPAGFGKTSFCKWQTINDLKAIRESESDVIPSVRATTPGRGWSHGLV